MKFLKILSSLAFIWGWACDPVEETPRFEPPQSIVGGVETHYDSWQGVVQVVGNDTIFCTGTFIHPRVVLTAGHCVLLDEGGRGYDFTRTPSVVAVYGGSEGRTLLARARQVSAHPDWTGAISLEAADLALIRLDREVTSVEAYRLRDFPFPEVGDPGVIVGYGLDEASQAGIHRMGETTIRAINPFFIEIGGESNTCNGDSGGPLFTQQDGEWVLSGVTSFGTEECYLESFGYSLNPLSRCDWLNQEMSSMVGEDLGLEGCQECQAAAVSDWGDPCGPGYPCCPEGTLCRRPESFSSNQLGYCAPACCDIEQPDAAYCTDIAGGEERCSFFSDEGEAYCAVHCEDDDDCRPGTQCRNKPYTSDRICIAREEGSGEEVECDTDSEDEPLDNAEGCGCSLPSPPRSASVMLIVEIFGIGKLASDN